MNFSVGHDLSVQGVKYLILGSILYRDRGQGDEWEEYRLRNSNDGSISWLSYDTGNDEYEMSFMVSTSNPPQGYHRVDSGTQVVCGRAGDVDVDNGETAQYETWEDAEGEHTFSVERWSDGTEYSRGMYVERSDIKDLGPSPDAKKPRGNGCRNALLIYIALVMLFPFLSLLMPTKSDYETDICAKLDNDYPYIEVTEAADSDQPDVKTYATEFSVYDASNDIIKKLEGYVRNVREDDTGQTVAILTDNEYILVYKDAGEDGLGQEEVQASAEDSTKEASEKTDEDSTAETSSLETNHPKTLVQVSSRKHAYSTDRRPYHARHSSYLWYRQFYRAVGYTSDSESYKDTESSYSHYTGETAIDSSTTSPYETYASSVRQESIAAKKTSGGGTSYGK